jgi:hypothetical protein
MVQFTLRPKLLPPLRLLQLGSSLPELQLPRHPAFDFDGLVLEIGRCYHRFFYPNYVVFVHLLRILKTVEDPVIYRLTNQGHYEDTGENSNGFGVLCGRDDGSR